MHGRGDRPVAPDLRVAKRRAAMLAAARGFFADHGVLEVETPTLSRSAASDPNIESLRVVLTVDPHDYYLHTSPEFALKRLLCEGWPDVYQISRVFRDGEIGRYHQPEFTLVEWYRLGISYSAMMDHTVAFITTLLSAPPVLPAQYVSYVEAFERHASLDPLHADTGMLSKAAAVDSSLSDTIGDDRDAWLDLILAERIAPQFQTDRLTVLHHYPASQAALARRCPDDSRLADRFEVFYGDVELANGYCELTDAAEQRQRCHADQERRQRRGQAERPLDEAFLAALDRGLPPCCGVAVGFDRLLMIDCGLHDIRDVVTFPFPEQDDD